MRLFRGSQLFAAAMLATAVVLTTRGFAASGPRPVTAAADGTHVVTQTVLSDRVRQLTRESTWTLVESIPIGFRTFHPQGLVRIGDSFVVSAVEVKVPTKRYVTPVDGYDRDTGAGVGHLFKFDSRGALISDVTIGAGSIYHPGGLDYDGVHIWVPLTEYRPDSHSIVYSVDAATMRPAEVLRVDDSIGGVAYDRMARTLHGVSWGSRRFYAWPLSPDGHLVSAAAVTRVSNPSHYVDYQDCKYVGAQEMLCTGLADVTTGAATPTLRLGGVDLVSLVDFRPIHQVPVGLRTPTGAVLMQNPSWFEATETGLRGYFMPEDDQSTLYVYDITP